MNLEYLRSFYMIVQYGNMTKAAKALHFTLPGLSVQLKKLEKEFDSKLLIRSNKGIRLTKSGEIVYKYADDILNLGKNIQRDLKYLIENKIKLNIGCCKSFGLHDFPYWIYTFKKFHKEIDINIELINCSEVIEKLCNHTINIGFVKDIPPKNCIVTKYINSDELILVGNKNYNTEIISIEKLKNMPLILREKTCYTMPILEREFEKKHISLKDFNIIYRINSSEAIKSSVSAGKGFSFLPKSAVEAEIERGYIKQIQLDRIEIKFNHYLAFRKEHKFASFEKKFVNFVISTSFKK